MSIMHPGFPEKGSRVNPSVGLSSFHSILSYLLLTFFLNFWFAAALLVVIAWSWCVPLVLFHYFVLQIHFYKLTDTVFSISNSSSHSSDVAEYSELDSEVWENLEYSELLSNMKLWISSCVVNFLFWAAIIFE